MQPHLYPLYTHPSSLNAQAGCLATSLIIPNTWEQTRAAMGYQLLPTDNSKKGVSLYFSFLLIFWVCTVYTFFYFYVFFLFYCYSLFSYMLLLYSCIFPLYSYLILSELSFTYFFNNSDLEYFVRSLQLLLPLVEFKHFLNSCILLL